MPKFLPNRLSWIRDKAIKRRGRRAARRYNPKQLISGSFKAKKELKYQDMNTWGAVPAAGGTVINMNGVAEGTEYYNRVGRAINGVYIQLDYYVIPPTGAGNVDSGMIAIVYDVANSQLAVPVYGDIFDTTVINNPGIGYRNLSQNTNRFKVLYQTFWGPASGGTVMNNCRGHVLIKIPRGLTSRYQAAALSVPLQGAIYYVVGSIANTGVAATSSSVYSWTRFAWLDL